uniref:Actinodin1 n=1 Tax=Mastacembelus armatus TaxID=205130 RepID=A0A3Q3M3K8_9TELE
MYIYVYVEYEVRIHVGVIILFQDLISNCRFYICPGVTSAFLFPSCLSAGKRIQERAAAATLHRRLIRNRRNISWYKQHSDFWGWYKYFTDNGNQEVHEMDRIYLAYLQNKNRAEGRRSYKDYLRHLGEIYKSCADSDDPSCVASYTSRPKPKPEPPKLAPIKTCDPTKDSYCLYAALIQAAASTPTPVKAPAPLYVRSAAPAKELQSGYHYYSPSTVPFLSKEQKAELLRICSSDDVECLQYHLRAAYGYAPSAGALPSYAHLGCDPKKDAKCKPQLVQKAPSGLYLQYPNCDPLRDPFCAYAASLVAPAGPGSCNPLFEEGCNPLSATRFAQVNDPYAPQMETAPESNPNDPFSAIRDALATMHLSAPSTPRQQYPFSSPNYEEPAQQARHPLGPPGKTKEGYDCFIGYDRECYPVKPNEPRSGVHRRIPYTAEAYEPHLNADGTRNGVLEPANPHCDPEYDPNCRLRRYEPEQTHNEAQPERHNEEDHSHKAAESEQQPEHDLYTSYSGVKFVDHRFLEFMKRKK